MPHSAGTPARLATPIPTFLSLLSAPIGSRRRSDRLDCDLKARLFFMFVAAQIICAGPGNLEPDVRDGSSRYAIPAIDGSDIRSVQMHAIRQNQQLAHGELSRTEMRTDANPPKLMLVDRAAPPLDRKPALSMAPIE